MEQSHFFTNIQKLIEILLPKYKVAIQQLIFLQLALLLYVYQLQIHQIQGNISSNDCHPSISLLVLYQNTLSNYTYKSKNNPTAHIL